MISGLQGGSTPLPKKIILDHRMMADIFQFRSPTLATTFYVLVNVLNIISKSKVNVALCKSCSFFHKLIKTNDIF